MKDAGIDDNVVFIGYVVDREFALAFDAIQSARHGRGLAPVTTAKVRIFTKYNCE